MSKIIEVEKDKEFSCPFGVDKFECLLLQRSCYSVPPAYKDGKNLCGEGCLWHIGKEKP